MNDNLSILEFIKFIIQKLNLKNSPINHILSISTIDQNPELYKINDYIIDISIVDIDDDIDDDIDIMININNKSEYIIELNIKKEYKDLFIKIIYTNESYNKSDLFQLEFIYELINDELIFNLMRGFMCNDSNRVDFDFSAFGLKFKTQNPNNFDKKDLSKILNIIKQHNLEEHPYLSYLKEYN